MSRPTRWEATARNQKLATFRGNTYLGTKSHENWLNSALHDEPIGQKTSKNANTKPKSQKVRLFHARITRCLRQEVTRHVTFCANHKSRASRRRRREDYDCVQGKTQIRGCKLLWCFPLITCWHYVERHWASLDWTNDPFNALQRNRDENLKAWNTKRNSQTNLIGFIQPSWYLLLVFDANNTRVIN